MSAREADIDLIERESCVAKVLIPLKSSQAGRSIEVPQATADVVNVLHLLKILADIDRIAEYLCVKT
jgi:hypothetical protein